MIISIDLQGWIQLGIILLTAVVVITRVETKLNFALKLIEELTKRVNTHLDNHN